MIHVTRLNGRPFVLNAEIIRSVEENPDTVITLISGDHVIVKESMEELIARVIDYRRHLRTLAPAAEAR